jgi:type VI protein secretion system component Hcp
MRKSIVLTVAALFAAAAAGQSPAVARPKVSEISVTKKIDKASPKLLRANTAPRDVATGQASGKRQHAR